VLDHYSKRLVIVATTIGNMIEWYEFGLYMFLAPIISRYFFPESLSLLNATTYSLLIFAIGFISRPFGGLFFGFIGDRYGRRISLVSSIMMMTVPTFCMGLLPTYQQIGFFAPLLLCLMRLLQSFPVGGEFPGSICYLTENAEIKERGFMGSFACFGAQFGVLLNLLECMLMENFLTHDQLLTWGWRFAFFVGGSLGLTGFFLRYKLKETPLFLSIEKQELVVKAPIREVLKHYKKQIGCIFLLGGMPIGGFYLLFVLMTFYLEEYFGVTAKAGLVINFILIATSTVMIPFLGKIADRLSIKRILIVTACLTLILAFPFIYLIGHKFYVFASIVAFILTVCFSFHFSMVSQTMAMLFPTPIRFTGLAFSYNISNICIAGSLPYLAIYLISKTGSLYVPAYMFAILALLTLIGTLILKEGDGELILESK
jgi:MHS family proline/betaine transporter-like MFS transporter